MSWPPPFRRYRATRACTVRLLGGPLSLAEGQIVECDGMSLRIGGRVYSGLAVTGILASGVLELADPPAPSERRTLPRREP